MVKELLDALELEDDPDSEHAESEDEVVASVSQSAAPSQVKRRTMRLCGRIGKLIVLILIDSGSVGMFISDKLASQLQMNIECCDPMMLVAVDGSPMICNQKILNLQWSSQG